MPKGKVSVAVMQDFFFRNVCVNEACFINEKKKSL